MLFPFIPRCQDLPQVLLGYGATLSSVGSGRKRFLGFLPWHGRDLPPRRCLTPTYSPFLSPQLIEAIRRARNGEPLEKITNSRPPCVIL